MAKKRLGKSTKKETAAAQSNIDVDSMNVGNVGGSVVIGHGNTIINLTPAQAAFRSLHQLPQPPADFTGREELIAQLLADFKGGTGATIAGLTGMGGIGKTALGLVVARQVAKDYPDAQIFLDLKGTTTPLSAVDVMQHVILSFEPARDLRTLDETNMADTYQSILYGKRALLFLDNARSPEQIAPLRPPESCALLVTSRWSFPVPGLHNRRVDLMSEENAKAFLLELCPRIGEHAARLAQVCGYLPIALRIAASFLGVNEHWNVKEYVDQLKDRRGRLAILGQSREEAELRTEPDLLATFELSYGQLSEDDKKRWRMLGVFQASFDWMAASAMWALEQAQARKTLGVLLRYSLLDYHEASSRYSLHDLLADYALSQMDREEEQGARLKHASHYKDVLVEANRFYLQGGGNVLIGLGLFDLEWENIRRGQAWVSAAGNSTRVLAELCAAYTDSGMYVLNLRLHPREQISWLEATISAARQNGDRGAEGRALGNLGVAYRTLGDVRKAIEFHERYLAIAQEIGDRRGEGSALGKLGVDYHNLGEVHKAIEFYEARLAITREIGDRRGEGSTLGNLGNAYHDLGEVRKAIEFHEGHLAIAREIGDRRSEGGELGNLGNAYHNLGEVRKAIEFYEARLAITREIGDRGGEGTTLGNLGVAYHDLDEVRKAIEFYEQDLAIAREIGHRRSEGMALGNLGNAYRDVGEVRKAIEFYEGYLAIAREISDRRGEGSALGYLGMAYRELGEVHKAIEFYEGRLAIAREISDRRSEGRALGNLGIAYGDLGEERKAIEFFEQYLAIAQELGDRSAEGRALFNMGLALHELEEKDRAIHLVKQALEVYEEIESPNAERARKQLKEWGV